MTAKTYNGHPNRAQWNVSLWINNDEGLYNMARDAVRTNRGAKMRAAEEMLEQLNDAGITHTPDGVKYTKTSIRHAMVEM